MALDQDRRPLYRVMGRLGPGLAREAGLAGDAASAARAGYVRAYDKARAAGDIEAMAEAALGLAATQTFGTFPGRVPAFLHEAYSLAQGEQRGAAGRRVGSCLGLWLRSGAGRGFAAEALSYAEAHDDPPLLAAAVDAQLLVHWGPDDLAERLSITARLEDTVAHVADAESRMSAHLWRLTTALECLDLSVVRRQLRALDLLAAETGTARVRFFAASRFQVFQDRVNLANHGLQPESFAYPFGDYNANMQSLLDWLSTQVTAGAVAVETTGQVIGGTYKPPFCC